MCGITALIGAEGAELGTSIRAMTETLVHRGPDDSGFAVLPEDGVALGMRRLSILDLEGGHQPMWDERSDHAIVFNGEIYNSAALRRELVEAGHRFVTDHSDTEALVHGFEQWGASLFPRLNGMFALVIWDRAHRQLVVARDRTGEKPLYIARLDQGYAVASELKALFQCSGLRRQIDAVALEQYLTFGYSIGPRTVLSSVQKLPAGHYGTIGEEGFAYHAFWKPSVRPTERSEQRSAQTLDELLDRSVQMRMVADVPVGLFLSGGLDSTAVGYYMTRHSSEVHSFSIGFEEKDFDESSYAQMAAAHLGTRHNLEIFPEQKAIELIPRVATILDEPMADESILPTHLLSRLAAGSVKVALGGDGADELLMGYVTYQGLKVAWQLERIPHFARALIARQARRLPNRLGPFRLRGKRFAESLAFTSMDSFLRALSRVSSAATLLSQDVRRDLPASVFDEPALRFGEYIPKGAGSADSAIISYLRGYLQEDILVKVDRASMATSLEVRAPFLDPNVIDFLGGVKSSLKMRGLTRKSLLRRVMRGRIPDAIIDRPKHGFGVPVHRWLRASLRPLVREYLSPARLSQGGLFDPATVTTAVEEHLDGSQDHGNALWSLLLFELWRERWLDVPGTRGGPPPPAEGER